MAAVLARAVEERGGEPVTSRPALAALAVRGRGGVGEEREGREGAAGRHDHEQLDTMGGRGASFSFLFVCVSFRGAWICGVGRGGTVPGTGARGARFLCQGPVFSSVLLLGRRLWGRRHASWDMDMT